MFGAAWRVCVPGTVTPSRVCVLCGMFVHAVLRSCPGPALVSTASVSALAVVAGGQYARGLDCSVTVYSPDGLSVALVFTSSDTGASFDCTCIGGRSSRAVGVFSIAVVERWAKLEALQVRPCRVSRCCVLRCGLRWCVAGRCDGV